MVAPDRTCHRSLIYMDKDPSRFDDDGLTRSIIGAAIEVHDTLGPGLLESAYHDCLCYELRELGLQFERQPLISLAYKAMRVERAFRPDVIVERSVVVELKSVEKILPIHESQTQTYLKLTGLSRGLIFNFNTRLLKSGIRRIEPAFARTPALSLTEEVSPSPFAPAPH